MSTDEDQHARNEDVASDVNVADSSSDESSSLTEEGSSNHGSQSDDEKSLSDSGSDMAHRLIEAGSGESLIGSDYSESEDQYLAEEEEYIINEALLHDRELARQRASGYSEYDSSGTPASTNQGESESGNELDRDDEFWESLSPAPPQEEGAPEDGTSISDELLKPQRGFASSPEPLFSDFFGNDEAPDPLNNHDDDEELTVYEDSSSENESSSTISDTCSLSTPLIAHIGTSQNHSGDPFGHSDDENFPDEAQHEVPLLVIEDLDGRLIYARAGDGEAVFGSDGEFEFAGDSEDYSSDDDHDGPFFNDLALPTHGGYDMQDTCDDGDTTDELPDEDMPFPRLLIGSVAPRGGRNARRAREIAARTRLSSPRVSSPTPSSSQRDHRGSVGPSSLSRAIAIDDSAGESDVPDAAPETPMSNRTISIDLSKSPQQCLGEDLKPEMGQFLPAISKSVHRAVIDGSTRAPSPFSTLQSLRGSNKNRSVKRHSSHEPQNGDLFSIPKRARAESANEILARQFDEDHGEVYAPLPRQSELSPEPRSEAQMDIGDLLDEDLLKGGTGDAHDDSHGSDSSENVDSDGKRHPQRMRRSHPGLNFNAFARWNRIPMGAFRNSQQQGQSNGQTPLSSAYINSQGPSGTFLLTNPFQTDSRYYLSPSTRRGAHTPMRRDASSMGLPHAASPLHRTLSVPPVMKSPQALLETTLTAPNELRKGNAAVGDHRVDGDRFLVSPMLMPVKNSGKSVSPHDMGTPSLTAISDPNSRKHRMTRREKRERLRRNEEQRKSRGTITAEVGTPLGK